MEEINKTVSQVFEKINKMTILTWITKEREERQRNKEIQRGPNGTE